MLTICQWRVGQKERSRNVEREKVRFSERERERKRERGRERKRKEEREREREREKEIERDSERERKKGRKEMCAEKRSPLSPIQFFDVRAIVAYSPSFSFPSTSW